MTQRGTGVGCLGRREQEEKEVEEVGLCFVSSLRASAAVLEQDLWFWDTVRRETITLPCS